MRLVEGRTFDDSTRAGHELLVSEGFARKHWGSGSALGRRVRIIGYDGKGDWSTVIGVVADASTGGLTDQRSDPLLYLPDPDYYSPAVIVRTKAGANALPALRSLVASLDAHLPPPTITSVEAAMRDSAAGPRFTMALLVTFTALALLLAAIGLYGVMAYAVAQRTREIGIRIALGATRRTIARAVMSNGLMLSLAGAAAGLTGAWWASKVLEKMLYGVERTDALSFAAGAVVLLTSAMVSCIVPMNRATSVDPLIAMRAE